MSEVFTRLSAVESGLASHISSCTERRFQEEERQRNNELRIHEVKSLIKEVSDNAKETNGKLDDVKLSVTEIKARFAIIVTLGGFILSLLGDFVAAWVGK